MLAKLKENLALIVTAITLMGSIGAGVQSLTAVIDTLTGIDDRMNIIETDFQVLKDSTMVSNDIAVLYEKISALEAVARDEHINFDNNFQDSQEYSLQKWEWQDIQKKITTLENNQLESWELDNLRDRITYLEAYMHQH